MPIDTEKSYYQRPLRLRSSFFIVICLLLGACSGSGDGGASLSLESPPPTSVTPTPEPPPSTVIPVLDMVSVTAWVGSDDSIVDFDPNPAGVEFYRHRDRDCDLANYSTCLLGQLDMLNGDAIHDTALTLTNTAHYTLATDSQQSETTSVNLKRYPDRSGHRAISFLGRLWIISGSDETSAVIGDVWSSSDGATWVEHSFPEELQRRRNFQVLVFDNRLWLLGGLDPSSPGGSDFEIHNDVWFTEDGENWQEITSENAFTPRYGHEALVYRDRIWVFGGSPSFRATHTDTWSSADGANWEQESAALPFPLGRDTSARIAVLNGVLWFVGGENVETIPNDFGIPNFNYIDNEVWKSDDGVVWQKQSAETSVFSTRRGHTLTTFAERLWIVGGVQPALGYAGSTPRYLSDAWSSVDGLKWERQADFPLAGAQSGVMLHDEALWVIGGENDSFGAATRNKDDIWFTNSGEQWSNVVAAGHNEFGGRRHHQIAALDNKLIMLAEYVGQARGELTATSGNIWTSVDGIDWQEVENNLLWTRDEGQGYCSNCRAKRQLTTFNGKVWLTGGGIDYDEIWSSVDGERWELEVDSPEFGSRIDHHVVVFNGRLWMIGGRRSDHFSDSGLPEVWSSSDGLNWVMETMDAGFYPNNQVRYPLKVATTGDRLWVSNGTRIWTSTNGSDWTRAENSNFPIRTGGAITSFQNQLWLFKGRRSIESVLDPTGIWSSDDGISWVKHRDEVLFEGRTGQQVIVYDQKVWMIGGATGSVYDQSDIWSSEDGINWYLLYKTGIRF